MWDEAAKWLNKFDEVVLTVLDSDGYPASVRVDSQAYDPATGELPAAVPDALRVVEGPANLLCHYHDEKLWKLNAIQHQGPGREPRWRMGVRQHDIQSAVQTGDVCSSSRGTRTSGQKYLDKRGLDRPEVDWAAAKEIQRRAKAKKWLERRHTASRLSAQRVRSAASRRYEFAESPSAIADSTSITAV